MARRDKLMGAIGGALIFVAKLTDKKTRKFTVPKLHGSRPKWSLIRQLLNRYSAPIVHDRLFPIMVVCLGALSVALTAAILFWH